ncbi:MAG: hypothetical protein FWF34_02585 [Alphaproteobacteria bacterium]|nr:hypothetical protein [Alphaproteobacteria bacterium]MCL2890118.1 hypothetical protein [Alphaproteobacteria bacterium]
MKEKIKNLFEFVGRAWRGGTRGKIGLALAVFSIFVIARMFVGTVSVQALVMNGFKLKKEQQQLATEQAKLDDMNMHIRLVTEHSPDYIEELAAKRLNLGDPKVRILR